MGDYDVPGIATGRVVEVGAVQTAEGEPLDGVLVNCSVSSTQRIGRWMGERVVVLPLADYQALLTVRHRNGGLKLTASQERALRFVAEGKPGRAHYTSRSVLQHAGLIRRDGSDYFMTSAGNAHLDALAVRDTTSGSPGDRSTSVPPK